MEPSKPTKAEWDSEYDELVALHEEAIKNLARLRRLGRLLIGGQILVASFLVVWSVLPLGHDMRWGELFGFGVGTALLVGAVVASR